MLYPIKIFFVARFIIFLSLLISFKSYPFERPNSKITHILSSIPFNIVGINLCEFSSAYSHNRIEYMRQMIKLSKEITRYPSNQTAELINEFNTLYEKNMNYAKMGLGKNLEVSFKAFIEQYYSDIRPKIRNIYFKQNEIDTIIIGHYAFSPHCTGEVQVSLELIDSDGASSTYQATGHIQTVMSKLASRVFEKYQRTILPTFININNDQKLEILGGANGDIAITKSLKQAQIICDSLKARLPTLKEYEMINALGSWSGGISLGEKAWALNYPNVYLYNAYRSGIVNIQFLKPQDIYYVCVR